MSGRIENGLKQLEELPELEPPAALEAKTLDAMAAATRAHRGVGTLARAAVWLGALGAAALLAVLAVDVDESVPPVDATSGEDLYHALLAESDRLEQALYALPPPRQVMRVSTAGTIVGLENRIALIDAELTRAAAEAGPPEYRNALLRDRVDAMNALVNVRYAQSRAFSF